MIYMERKMLRRFAQSRKIFVRALLCSLITLIPFREPESQIYDWKLRLLKNTYWGENPDILLLELSRSDFSYLQKRFGTPKTQAAYRGTLAEKFDTIRNQFLWDDSAYQALLGKLLAQDPKHVLVTLFFHDGLIFLQNKPELQRLARNPKVLWGSQFDLDQKMQKPATELIGRENYGFTNLMADSDGIVRRAWLIASNHMSLPYRALLQDKEDFLKYPNPSEAFLIHFGGNAFRLPSCSVQELFEERCPEMKGKFVVLSPAPNTAPGANLYQTPLGTMGRGEVLAHILLTAKNKAAYFPVSTYLLFLFVFIHVLALAFAILNFSFVRHVPFAFGVLAAELLLALAAMRFLSLQIPLMPFVAGTLASYLAFLWLKFAQQESKRWEAEKKAEVLRELDELKSNFLSLMSHDLKTPIAKVQALTERLFREASGLNTEQKEILAGIQRSNEELAQYILSLLNFQKIESQEIRLNKKSADINLLIEEVVERLEPLAQDKKISLQMELEPMFSAEFDEQLIRQVLNNLIDNAIKYNVAGTVVIIRSADQGDFLEVSVSDNGIGLEEEQKARLFQKFSRKEPGTAERVKGTGLGLYLAKYFIELHGGSIHAESTKGQGACFRFRLPV